jgi:hypothetical protein
MCIFRVPPKKCVYSETLALMADAMLIRGQRLVVPAQHQRPEQQRPVEHARRRRPACMHMHIVQVQLSKGTRKSSTIEEAMKT